MLISVDEVENSTFALEERIGNLEEQNSLLLARLNVLESTVSNVESDVQSKSRVIFTSNSGLLSKPTFLYDMILSLIQFPFRTFFVYLNKH